MKFYFKISLFILLSFFNSILCLSQNIDSLQLALKNSKQDTSRLYLLVQLSEVCELNDILNYTKPAVELADKLLQDRSYSSISAKILNLKAGALNNIGFFYES